MRILTSSQMRAAEEMAKQGGVSESEMMEAAGAAVAKEILELPSQGGVLVLCGPGNNGGDGFVVARCLRESGRAVTGVVAIPTSKLRGEPLKQYKKAVESDVPIFGPDEDGYDEALNPEKDYDVVVDAILGTGLKGRPKDDIADLIEAADTFAAFVVSVDLPSGIDPDTGLSSGIHVDADQTVCIAAPKPFLFQNDGLEASGLWTIADIGIGEHFLEVCSRAEVCDTPWVYEKLPSRGVNSHKRNSGVVLVIAGSKMYPGAATLAALGAIRQGAGLVTVASIPFVLEGVRNHLPECPLLHLPEENGQIAIQSVEVIADYAKRCDAIIVGPGLGRSAQVSEFLDALFSRVESRWVLDADALNALPELKNRPRGSTVLTPHMGEAARLLLTASEEVIQNRFSTVKEIVEKYSCAVLLKGPFTLICAPEQDVLVNTTGNALLATAGTGDVLSGAIGALLSLGMDPFDAAAVGAFCHGASADCLAKKFDGLLGATAWDIAEAIPEARQDNLANFLNELVEDESRWEEERANYELEEEEI